MGSGVRGAGLALMCALVTAAGHSAGGGALPDLALLVVLLPLLGGVLTHVARRATGPVGLVAVLGGGQLALHHLLELLHPAHAAGPALLGGTGMLVLHAVATVVLAVAVRGADAGIAAVAAGLRRVLPRRLPPPVTRAPAVAVPVAPVAGLRLAAALCSAEVRRGPPVRC